MPRVSVIIPARNAAGFIAEAIASVRGQTYADWEVVVADDGSTDSTASVLAALRHDLGDRLQVLQADRDAPHGVGAARNRAVAASRGRYLAFLDADDVWLPSKLAEQVAVLDAYSDVDLVFAEAFCVDDDLAPLEPAAAGGPVGIIGDAPRPGRVADAYAGMVRQVVFPPCLTVVTRRDALQRAGGFPERLRFQVEDAVAWARIGRQGDFFFLPRILALYRVHRGSWTAAQTRLSHLHGVFEIYRALVDDPAGVPPVLRERLHRMIPKYLGVQASVPERLRAAARVFAYLSRHKLLDPAVLLSETAASVRGRAASAARRLTASQ